MQRTFKEVFRMQDVGRARVSGCVRLLLSLLLPLAVVLVLSFAVWFACGLAVLVCAAALPF